MDDEMTRPGLQEPGGRAGNPYNPLRDPTESANTVGVPVPNEPDDALAQETAAAGAPKPIDKSVVGSSDARAMEIGADLTRPSTEPGGPSANAKPTTRRADRIFAALTAGSGALVVLLIGLIALFLVLKALPAIQDDKANFLFSREWSVTGDSLRFGIIDLLWVTVVISLLAMIIAVPVAIGIALFITQYAPARLARPVAYIIDLLAAIPSIVYGVWGIAVLAPKLRPVQRALSHLDFIPLFKNQNVQDGTIFNGAVVLAIMILPIVTAISRDVFERTPRQNIEAAWALGATRWEMIRLAVLPYGKPGVVSGAMLGLGRALGETIAVYLILSKPGVGAPFSWSLFNGGETFASKIARNAAEFNEPVKTSAYIASGLVLFLLTFAVNAAARSIVNRRKDFR